MTLMTTLAVDIAQPTDGKGLSSIEDNRGQSSGNDQFASYMAHSRSKNEEAKRQSHAESNETAVKPDNTEVKNTDKQTDIASEKTSESAKAIDENKVDKAAKNQEQAASAEKQDVQVASEKAQQEKVNNVPVTQHRAEVAIQLIDFINSSEETSTEREINSEVSDTTKIAIEINTRRNALPLEEIKHFPEQNIGKLKTMQGPEITTDASEQTLSGLIKGVSGESLIVENKNPEQSEKSIQIETLQHLSQAQSNEPEATVGDTEQLNVNKAKVLLSGEQATKLSEQANDQHKTTVNHQDKSTVTLTKDEKVAVEVEDGSSVEAINVDSETQQALDSRTQGDVVSPIKPGAEQKQPVDVNKAQAENRQTIELEVAEPEMPVNANPSVISNDVTKPTISDRPIETRVINQATKTVVANELPNDAQNTSNPEGGDTSNKDQQPKEQVFAQMAKENVKPNQDASANNVRPTTNVAPEPTTAATLSQDAEASALHAVTNRATPESLATQSVKSVQAVMQDTIAINRKDFSVAVKEKVMVAVNQKLRQLDIRLDPPELGSMQIKVNMQNEQAAVSFIVQNQQARDALEQHMGKLKDMLGQSGVDVGDTNIEQRDNQGNEEQLSQNQGSQDGSVDEEELAQQSQHIHGNLYKASSTGVDYYA